MSRIHLPWTLATTRFSAGPEARLRNRKSRDGALAVPALDACGPLPIAPSPVASSPTYAPVDELDTAAPDRSYSVPPEVEPVTVTVLPLAVIHEVISLEPP